MRRSIIALLLATSLTAAAGAAAQEDPRKVQAAPFFEEGRKLAEKGQNADSLERFKRAYAIYPSPNTLFNVARQEHLLGRRLDAIRDYRAALDNAVLLPAVADLARTYVAELERVLARVKVVGPEGARVTVGGADYTLPMARPIDVEPGSIAISGSHGSERYATSAEVLAGGLATVTVGVAPASASSPSSSASPAVDDHAGPVVASGSNTTRNVVAGSLVVVGLVGIGLGVGFTVAANGSSDDLAKARADAGPNADQACAAAATPRCQARATAADDLARNTNVARAMFVGGGIALVGGAVAFLVWPKAKSADASGAAAARLSPWVGSRTLGLSYGRSF